MKEYIIDFFIGCTLSSIPIFILTKYYFENSLTNKDFDFPTTIKYLPLKMGIANLILFALISMFNKKLSTEPIVMGFLMSIVISMLTKTFNEIPDKVIKMKNSNLYHIYSIIVFAIAYFILFKIKNKIITS